MTQTSKEELLREVKKRYLQADYKTKIEILNEFCHNTGYHRKHAIRILAAGYAHKSADQRKKRAFVYGIDLFQLIIKIWELLEYPCGKRLQPALLTTAEALERSKEILPLTEHVKEQLCDISAHTLDNRLKRERVIRRLKKIAALHGMAAFLNPQYQSELQTGIPGASVLWKWTPWLITAATHRENLFTAWIW